MAARVQSIPFETILNEIVKRRENTFAKINGIIRRGKMMKTGRIDDSIVYSRWQ